MDWMYDKGDKLYFNCTDSDWRGIKNVECEVMRRLTDEEADLCETGPMYEVGFREPVEIQESRLTSRFATYFAFEDELTPWQVDHVIHGYNIRVDDEAEFLI